MSIDIIGCQNRRLGNNQVMSDPTKEEQGYLERGQSKLDDLARRLRSVREDDRQAAVIRYVDFLQEFPYPTLVNKAYLRLAEHFRTR